MKWVFGVLFVLLIGFASANDFGLDSKEVTLDMNIKSNILVLPNSPNYALSYALFKLSFFPRETWQQSVLELTSEPKATQNDTMLVFRWDNPGASSLSSSVDAKVRIKNSQIGVGKKIGFPLDIQGLDEYLKPTTNIDSDDPEIVRLASLIAAGQDDLSFVVFELFRWVQENVEYNMTPLTADVSQPASWVLKNRYGVCDELTSLFMALSRSIGIPSRYVSGVAYTNFNDVNDWQSHSWAELYYPEYGWIPFDATYGEFGFVDPTHVVLKVSVDSNESTSWLKWMGDNVQLVSQGLEIDTKISKKSGVSAKAYAIETRPLLQNVGFGSYNLIKTKVQNLMDYYLGVEVGLSRTSGLETIGLVKQHLLLKPNEEKFVYWVVKVDEGLERRYVYTFPISISTKHNVSALTSFKASADERVYSRNEIFGLLAGLENEQQLVYSKEIEIECSAPDVYLDEASSVLCEFRNTGNVFLEKLSACLERDCQSLTLGIGRRVQLEYDVGPIQKPGKQVMHLVVKNDQVAKTSQVGYSVMDLPVVAIQNISYPQEVGYSGSYNLSFILDKQSESFPVNLSVEIGSVLEKTYYFERLDNDKSFRLGFNGNGLKPGVNRINIAVRYFDTHHRGYLTEQTIVIVLKNLTLVERLQMVLRDLDLWLQKIFQKVTANS
ncbi:MAG: transglutaminase-like domain-containing protein [Candidatus Woesearchaeota archaeon]